ncbi:MAG: hypothetical protein ACXACG_02585 [Candidatus Thorarchaeota archaeon]|jgi:hypothetical protein
MKPRPLASILFLAILLAPMFGPVFAQSNHTLEWGTDPGEEFTYVLQRAYYADSSNRAFMEDQLPFLAEMEPGQKVLIEVDHLDAIEILINESIQLPRSYCNLLRSNDSAIIIPDLESFVVPINDWEFLDEVENITGTVGLTLIDTEDEWGTIGVGIYQGTGGGDITIRVEMRYEKENGTLNYLRHRYSSLGSDFIDVIFVHWYPGMPTIVGGGIQAFTLMIIALSGVMGLIISFIVYRVMKGKKSVVQRLGE